MQRTGLVVFFLFVFHPLFVSAQQVNIRGTVSDIGNIPLEGAYIQLEGTTYGASSDGDGLFEINQVAPGTYELIVSYIGYRTQKREVILTSDETMSLDIVLQEDILGLETVVVSGTRYAQDRSQNPIVVHILDDELMQASQSVTISEGLHYQPGVRVENNCQNCGFTQVRLNGLQGAYSQILINSRPVFSSLVGIYGLEHIPTNMVDRVEVVRGGGSSLYGSNAIAGTLNIITRDPVENTWDLRSNSSLIAGDALDQSFQVNGSIVSDNGMSGVTLYGMRRNRDSYDANKDGFSELAEIKHSVLGARAFLRTSKRSKLTLDLSSINEYRRGGDRLDLVPHFTDIAEQLEHDTYLGGLSFENWSKNYRHKWDLYGALQYTERESYYGGLGGDRTASDSSRALNAYGNTEDFTLTGGGQYTHYLAGEDVITLGIDYQYANTDDRIPGYERVVDQQVMTTGIFAQYEWNPTEKWTALMGLRYDHTNVQGLYTLEDIKNEVDLSLGIWSPRASVLYKINEDLRWRAGYSRGFRAPQAFDEELHIAVVGGEPLFVIPSQGLRPETSDALTTSLNYSSSSGARQIHGLVEGFITFLHDPLVIVSTGASLPNGSILEEVRNGQGASVAGINVEGGYTPSGKMTLQVGGTIQSTSYDEDQVLFESEGGSGESDVVIDEFVRTPNVYGYLTSNYRFWDSWSLDLTGTFTGPMIVPRVVSESGFLDLVKSSTFYDVNLKASYRISVADNLDIELSGGFKNIFNSFQRDFESGPMRDSDFIFGPLAPRSGFVSVRFGHLGSL